MRKEKRTVEVASLIFSACLCCFAAASLLHLSLLSAIFRNRCCCLFAVFRTRRVRFDTAVGRPLTLRGGVSDSCSPNVSVHPSAEPRTNARGLQCILKVREKARLRPMQWSPTDFVSQLDLCCVLHCVTVLCCLVIPPTCRRWACRLQRFKRNCRSTRRSSSEKHKQTTNATEQERLSLMQLGCRCVCLLCSVAFSNRLARRDRCTLREVTNTGKQPNTNTTHAQRKRRSFSDAQTTAGRSGTATTITLRTRPVPRSEACSIHRAKIAAGDPTRIDQTHSMKLFNTCGALRQAIRVNLARRSSDHESAREAQKFKKFQSKCARPQV